MRVQWEDKSETDKMRITTMIMRYHQIFGG
jgi:hypothetical protein